MMDGTDGGETSLKWVVDEPYVEDLMSKSALVAKTWTATIK